MERIMSGINAATMAKVKEERIKRKNDLNRLISTPFDLKNQDHLKALNGYINHFELSSNLMYLYQAMAATIKAWMGFGIMGFLIPVPGFILTSTFCIGAFGLILKEFSMTDFYERFDEMKALYSWCFDSVKDIHHDTLLQVPDIQRMIILLAPLSEKEDIIVWKNNSGLWSSIKNKVSSIGSTKDSAQLNPVNLLKFNVENKKLNIDVLDGLFKSLKYFTTSSEFRALLTTPLSKFDVSSIMNNIPRSVIESRLSHPRS